MNDMLSKYGLMFRTVEEDDAQFIVDIRTDDKVGDFLHYTSDNVEKQKNWIHEYKKREKNKTEFYFIYYKNFIPIGVNRIVVLNKLYCNCGSWVCASGSSINDVVATNLIANDYVFDILHIPVILFEVDKNNKKVWKFHEQKGAKRYYENDTHYFYTLTPEDYYVERNKLIKLLNL